MLGAGSTKACYNHTEGTAGLHGVLLAMHALQQAVTPPVQHARELNPYVAAALSDWSKASHLTSIISRVGCSAQLTTCAQPQTAYPCCWLKATAEDPSRGDVLTWHGKAADSAHDINIPLLPNIEPDLMCQPKAVTQCNR